MAIVIDIRDTDIPDGVNHIVDQLPSSDSLQLGDEITLRFHQDFVYVTGLVLLAAWRKSLPEGITIRLDDTRCNAGTQRFLSNTGFREVIDTGIEHPSVLYRMGRVPIQPIVGGWANEATVNEVCRIFDEYAGHVKDIHPFRVLLTELCENVLAHSQLTTPGYICARVLEPINKCEIAIADTGIGIERSFRLGTNVKALDRINRGTSALKIALEGLSSSKPKAPPGTLRSYFGFGLFIVRRLLEDNRGRLTLISGKESLTNERYIPQRITNLQKPYKGTFIGLVLDLGNPLPLADVYEEVAKLVIPEPIPPKVTKEEPKQVAQEEVRVDLSNYGTQLLTREAGTAIRADIATLLAIGKRIVVGLGGIEDITPSCADEAFGKLAEVIGFADLDSRIKFEGGQPIAHRLIEFVLKARQTRRA